MAQNKTGALEMYNTKMYDTIIIGGGPAGLSAAIYTFRFNMKTLVLAKDFGGLIARVHLLENWPGFAKISGKELMDKLIEHCKAFKISMREAEVSELIKENKEKNENNSPNNYNLNNYNYFSVKTKDGKKYKAKTIILATGSSPRRLGVPGEKELLGKGVSYCATCDGMFFKNKAVAVIGGSDSAAKEALLLSEHCKKVYIIYRREKIRAEPLNAARIEKNEKIEIITNTNVLEIKGRLKGKEDRGRVEKLILDNSYKGSKEFPIDGVFIEIGHEPLNNLAKQLNVKLNEKGEIVIDEGSRTSIEGVYAAGDIASGGYKQAITGAAEGVKAAFSAFKYIGEKGL